MEGARGEAMCSGIGGAGLIFCLELPQGFKGGITATSVKSIVKEAVKLWRNKTSLGVEHKWNTGGMFG